MKKNTLGFYFLLQCLSIIADQVSENHKGPEWRKKVFNQVYKTALWAGGKKDGSIPLSGEGSMVRTTSTLRSLLPSIIEVLNVKTVVDAGCGDFTWMQTLNLPLDNYIGIDIVDYVIEENKTKYQHERRTFLCLDITKDQLPSVDLIICRDCLQHLSYADMQEALANFKRSGAKYLLTTTYPDKLINNNDIRSGDFHTINLQAHPFNFPEPLIFFREFSAEKTMVKAGKCMGVWRLEDIP